jgi:hypothetical protein
MLQRFSKHLMGTNEGSTFGGFLLLTIEEVEVRWVRRKTELRRPDGAGVKERSEKLDRKEGERKEAGEVRREYMISAWRSKGTCN